MPPRTHRHRNLRSALGSLLVLCAALAGSASGSPRRARATSARQVVVLPMVAGIHCLDAGRAEIAVGDGQGFDAIRVVVNEAVPGAATDVTVLVGPRDRTLRTMGGGEWGLALDEPLLAHRILVAIEPVLEAPAGACIQRVELLRKGAVVATARIP